MIAVECCGLDWTSITTAHMRLFRDIPYVGPDGRIPTRPYKLVILAPLKEILQCVSVCAFALRRHGFALVSWKFAGVVAQLVERLVRKHRRPTSLICPLVIPRGQTLLSVEDWSIYVWTHVDSNGLNFFHLRRSRFKTRSEQPLRSSLKARV